MLKRKMTVSDRPCIGSSRLGPDHAGEEGPPSNLTSITQTAGRRDAHLA